MNFPNIYYESHVTIEPVFDQRLEKFKEICKKYKFRVADLLMLKRKEDTPERSSFDSFCTGRDLSYLDLKNRMIELIDELVSNQFKVWRYKIESTIMDSRYEDCLHKLDIENIPEKQRIMKGF